MRKDTVLKELIAEFPNKPWTLKQIVVEDWHRRHHRKEAWQRVEPGSGQLLTKRSSSGIHVFELAFEHTEDILNIAFRHVWYLHKRTL